MRAPKPAAGTRACKFDMGAIVMRIVPCAKGQKFLGILGVNAAYFRPFIFGISTDAYFD